MQSVILHVRRGKWRNARKNDGPSIWRGGGGSHFESGDKRGVGGGDRRGEDKTRSHVCGCMRHTVGTEEERGGRTMERVGAGGGRFDMELHIIKPAPVFMVESHPPYLFAYPFLIPASSLAPSSLYSRHRAIKFGNSIPLAERLHTYTRTCHTRSLDVAPSTWAPRDSNLLRFISASKLMVEALPLQFRAKRIPPVFPSPSHMEISHPLLCHVCGSGVLVPTEKRVQVLSSYFCLQSLANLYAILRTT